MPKKMLQIIPKTLAFTPSATGATVTTFTDFAEAVSFTYEDSYGDIASQSSDYAIGKMLTARTASLKAVVNNFDLAQMQAMISTTPADYATVSDTLTFKSGNFAVNYGEVVFTGFDTSSGKNVTITLARAVAKVSGDMTFGKDSEAKLGVQFDAVRDADTDTVVTIAYAV